MHVLSYCECMCGLFYTRETDLGLNIKAYCNALKICLNIVHESEGLHALYKYLLKKEKEKQIVWNKIIILVFPELVLTSAVMMKGYLSFMYISARNICLISCCSSLSKHLSHNWRSRSPSGFALLASAVQLPAIKIAVLSGFWRVNTEVCLCSLSSTSTMLNLFQNRDKDIRLTPLHATILTAIQQAAAAAAAASFLPVKPRFLPPPPVRRAPVSLLMPRLDPLLPKFYELHKCPWEPAITLS